MSSSTPARQRRKAARPQELLAAGLSLLVRKGLAATRMEDVAREAGVSKGTLYLYYPSKDALFKAVLLNYLTQVIVEGTHVLAQFEGSTADLLRELAQRWWQQIGSTEASGLLMLLMSEAAAFPDLASFYVNEVVLPGRNLLRGVVERGMARGEFIRQDVNSVVHILMAPLQFLILYPRCTSICPESPIPIDPELFLNIQIEILLRGLAAPQSASECAK